MRYLDRVPTSFAVDQKRLHLLCPKLVRIPSGSPGLGYRAVQRYLLPDDGIFLTSYTLVVASHAVDSTTSRYCVPFSSGGLPQPWNALPPFPTEPGEWLVCPSDCIVAFLISAVVRMNHWSSLSSAMGHIVWPTVPGI